MGTGKERDRTKETGGRRRSIIQERDDKALSQHVENGKEITEAANAVKAKPINRTWRAFRVCMNRRGKWSGKKR